MITLACPLKIAHEEALSNSSTKLPRNFNQRSTLDAIINIHDLVLYLRKGSFLTLK